MQILNLKNGFEPFGPGTVTLVLSSVFSGGEINIRLDGEINTEVLISTRVNNSNDLMELLMATDALREIGAQKIHLFMPYLPYARQDRVCRGGEAFSLRVFARIINLQNYASMRVFEAHSDVASKYIDRFESIDNREFVRAILADKHDFWILYPDKGAFARYAHIFEEIGIGGLLCVCGKERSQDGAINATTIPIEDFGGKDVYMIDDICDGGRTFVALAKQLKERNVDTINLIVSHGIFSYGEQPLKAGGVDHIYTTDSFKDIDSSYITQVKLCDILM